MSPPTLDDLKFGRDGHLGYGASPSAAPAAPQPEPERIAFIGVSPCGCVPCYIGTRGDGRPGPTEAEARREAAKWLRDGLSVEQLPASEALARFHASPVRCTHGSVLPGGGA